MFIALLVPAKHFHGGYLIFTEILQTTNISILYLRKLGLREVKSQSSTLGRTSIKVKLET